MVAEEAASHEDGRRRAERHVGKVGLRNVGVGLCRCYKEEFGEERQVGKVGLTDVGEGYVGVIKRSMERKDTSERWA